MQQKNLTQSRQDRKEKNHLFSLILRIFAANLLVLARPGWAGGLSNSI